MKYLILTLILASCAQVPVNTKVPGNYSFTHSGSDYKVNHENDAIEYFYWISRENDVLEEKLNSSKIDIVECKANTSSTLDLQSYDLKRPTLKGDLIVKEEQLTVQQTNSLNQHIKDEMAYKDQATTALANLRTEIRSCHRLEANNARMKWELEKKQANMMIKQLNKKGRSIAQEDVPTYEGPAPEQEVPSLDDQQSYVEPQEREVPQQEEPQVDYSNPDNDY